MKPYSGKFKVESFGFHGVNKHEVKLKKCSVKMEQLKSLKNYPMFKKFIIKKLVNYLFLIAFIFLFNSICINNLQNVKIYVFRNQSTNAINVASRALSKATLKDT